MRVSRRFVVLFTLLLASALFAVLFAQPAMAADVHVNSLTGDNTTGNGSVVNPYATIGRGLTAASSGDTVWVAAGLYIENISLKSGVDLIGAGSTLSIIQGAEVDGAPVVAATTVTDATFDGFTVQGGVRNAGAGISINRSGIGNTSSPTIRECLITGNVATWGFGGGIYISAECTPTIEDCVITGNSSLNFGGGGIRCSGSLSDPIIRRCTISNNVAEDEGAGISAYSHANPTIEDCLIVGNSGGSYGAGIALHNDCGGVIRGNTITGNIGGGGLFSRQDSHALITGNTIAGNIGSSWCGGIGLEASEVVVNNVIVGNTDTYADFGGGGGIDISGSGSPKLINNTIVDNTAATGDGDGIYVNTFTPASPVIVNCIVWGNGDDLSGCTATYSNIEDGDAGTGNISSAPTFVSVATGDYRLQVGSSGIDVGGNPATVTVIPTVDKDGTVRPLDGDGNSTVVIDMGAYEYDGIAPTTTCDPDDDIWRSNDVTVTLTATDDGGVAETFYRLDSGDWQTCVGPFVVSKDGTTTVEYRSRDLAGNTEAVKTAYVHINYAGPVVTDDASPAWQTGPVAVTLQADVGVTIHYELDSSAPVTYTAPVPISTAGVHALEYWGTDTEGTTGPTGSATVRIDDIAPATTSDIDEAWQQGPVDVNLSAADGHSGVASVDATITDPPPGGSNAMSSASDTITFTVTAEGTTTVEYFATDVVGNQEAPSLEIVRIDDTTPTVSLTPTATAFTNSAHFSIEASDALSGVDTVFYSIDGAPAGTGTTPTVTAIGDHTIEVWAVDAAGNESAHVTHDFGVRPSTTQTTTYAGADRYATAVEVSKDAFPAGSDALVIATGEDWPDALGGTALAGVHDAPILLVRSNSVPPQVEAEIRRLDPSHVFVLGGIGAISEATEAHIRSIVQPTANLERFWGADRYETANVIATQVVKDQGGTFDGTAFVATGRNFPDAIAAAPLSVAGGWPLFLAGPDGLSDATLVSMGGVGVTDAIILGGDGVVPVTVETQLTGAGISHMRLEGPTRYGTARAIAEYGVASCGLHWDALAITTGQNFPDSLSGGVMQGMDASVMLLTPGDYLHADPQACLQDNRDYITSIKYFGGTGAVSQTVRDEVTGILY